jgi:N-acetylglucosamine-6-sulfatase
LFYPRPAVNRKIALVLAGALCAVLVGSGCGPPGRAHSAPAPRPNIVFVLTDDLAWNLVSHMPHVVALQQAGMTFSHYYVVDSLCCPSRSAIFTGEYPHDDGVFTNTGSDGGYKAYNAHGDQRKSFAVALQKSGYRTALMGKYLNGYDPADPVAPGWDVWDVTGNGYGEFNYSLNQNGTQHYYGDAPDDYLTDVLSAKATSFIASAASRRKPFLLEVATFAPHAPYVPAPRYARAAANVQYPKNAAYDRLPANPPPWLAQRQPLTPAQQAGITTVYRERVEADLSVDDMIGQLERELRAKGVAKNTYIVFSSDNGFHMGEYRLEPGKQTAFDTDINVPLIVSGPHVPAGRTVPWLASNIDLAPTFETLAGLKLRKTIDGHSLAALWRGQHPKDWRQVVLIEHHGPDDLPGDPDAQASAQADPPSYEAVRTENALYVLYDNGDQEFYDTATDPLELDNIASQGVPPELRKALVALEDCHNGATCWAAAHLH